MGSISVKNLGKAYKQYNSRFGRLIEWLSPFKINRHKLKWVLNDLNFDVAAGEAVGIIGINGAGKSTLLKMIVGTTRPTTGSVTMTGRVAALLELGMGFHPDFTGRQNVYMSGQLLGFSMEEINQLMPEIEAFAEIGDYIDQPVRVYSSGMQVRLAFSVATAVRPDILIVDEALSVGDAYFQHKSFERIREFRKKGTTLLIVSHDKQAIISICDKVILLNQGNLEKIGDPESIMDYYNALLSKKPDVQIQQVKTDDGKVQTISGSGQASVSKIMILDEHHNAITNINVGQKVSLVIEAEIKSNLPRLVLGYGIKDRLGQVMYGTNTALKGNILTDVSAGSRVTFIFDFLSNLGPGTYSIQTALVSSDTHLENNYEWRDLAFIFNVMNIDRDHFAGLVWLDPVVKIKVH